MDLWALLRDRLVPVDDPVVLALTELAVVLPLAFVAIAFAPLWQLLRLGVTLVHELGHAMVGVAVGREFTGFVLRGDSSGHAVTRGPTRGTGRVLSTWAGYPAPALVGAGMVWAAGRGWAAPVVSAAILVLVVSLVRAHSPLTATVTGVSLAATVALWWWRDDTVQAQVLIGVGIVLLVGAWRHLAAVLPDRTRISDPGVLVALTHVPRVVWNGSFVVVTALATWLVVAEVWLAVR